MLVERLLDPAAYPHPTGSIRLVETHISWVFLTGPFAYKLKKPVDLGFLDFTTLEQRKHFCEEEVRVSGRFAPEIYLAAVPITGAADRPHVGGDGEPIEWAVKLVQFDESDRLDNRFNEARLTAADCRALGETVARVEERLPVADPADRWGLAESVCDAVAINLAAIRTHRPDAAPRADRIGDWLRDRLAAAAPLLRDRLAAGRVRECHGDLHLANLVFHAGRMMAFDAIEFNSGLRWIDVANDVAFLAMDLHSRGRPDLAAQVVSSWVETANDHAAVALLPIYEVYRAVVRASIAAIRGGQGGDAGSRAETDRYLDLAEHLVAPGAPVMIATSGVSGSGKSTVAAELVGRFAAIRIRSDVERKRLAGLAASERPAAAGGVAVLYGEAATHGVYERLARLAATVLAAGTSVIVDAACNQRWQRDLLAGVSRESGVPLVWLDFDVPADVVLARVAVRESSGSDASDATCAIVRQQLASREPIMSAELVATGGRCVRLAGGAVDPTAVGDRVASVLAE